MAIDAHLGLAMIAAFRGDTVQARSEYQVVLTADPGNTSALIGLSQLESPHGSAAPTTQGGLMTTTLDPADVLRAARGARVARRAAG